MKAVSKAFLLRRFWVGRVFDPPSTVLWANGRVEDPPYRR
jgi:hypothetical protein